MSDYPMYIHVKVSIGGNELKSYCFDSGPINIGRGSDCQIVLDNPGISRVHASLEREGNSLRISDLESGNGTFVNGSEVQKSWVSSADTVRIGKFTLNFRLSPVKGAIVDSSSEETAIVKTQNEGQTVELSAEDRQKILLQAQALRAKAQAAPAAKAKAFNYFPLAVLFVAGTAFGLFVSWLVG